MQNDFQAFLDMRAARARKEGFAAYHAGACCKAPNGYGEHALNWVEGWTQAALEAARKAA